jgi:predicted DCC family thiol-disulfide oxidoreductase YuxK
VATVLYDDDCGFCVWCMGKVLALDRRGVLEPVALQDPRAEALLPGMDEETRMRSWHLVENGRVSSAGGAFGPLLRLLLGGPAAALADRAYYAVANRRSTFGKLVTEAAKRRARARIAEHRRARQ